MTATETKEALHNISEENKALRKQRKYREERIQELRQDIEAYVNDIRSIDTHDVIFLSESDNW